MSRIPRNLSARLAGLLVLFIALTCAAQSSAPAKAPSRPTSTPYTGDLSVFESPGRGEKLQINRVMDILKIAPGKGVADIGAGSGWFTVRAAAKVGPTGKVYAVDISQDAIEYIEKRAKRESLANIEPILCSADDPMLPKEAVDAVLILKTYHEVAHPITMLQNLRPALRTGARLGVIDRNGNGTDHGISRKVVEQEAAQAGFRLVESYDFVKGDGMDYFLVFVTN